MKSVVGNRMQIRVDGNETLNLFQAKEAVKALEPFGIEYLEQPMPHENLHGFSVLDRFSTVKLMADKSIPDNV